MIAGPFGVWPELYDEREAEAVMMEAKGRAAQTVAPQVMQQIIGKRMIMQARGVAPAPLDPNELRMRVETLAAPVWQQEMLTRFGASEPMTREALFRRLKVKVKSSLTSSLDRGQRIQSLSLLAQSTMQLAQAAQMSAIPFNARAFLQIGAKLVGEDEQLDQIFPAVPPVPMAAQGALAGAAGAGAPAGAAGALREGALRTRRSTASSRRSCARASSPPHTRRHIVHHSVSTCASPPCCTPSSYSVHSSPARHSSSGWPNPGRRQ